ncbi:hypothetical protein QSE00_11935 [Arenibacter sp. M-2]|uniref:hypothetical protein n=1 Tax=Arenibacter sp. M-2 TaxID=3053612 RepID=UPI0025704AF1|nr:hypothetical protein [Arenibacter sp. M-2]MDL5512530.1 hypothetical protein [Arenibacter sp. M-2]
MRFLIIGPNSTFKERALLISLPFESFDTVAVINLLHAKDLFQFNEKIVDRTKILHNSIRGNQKRMFG